MIRVLFKNLEKSEFAKELALERIETVMERFPDLSEHRIDVTLSMENSPIQAGPDLFTVKVFIAGIRYRSIVIQKSASSLYVALADVVEHTLERLNRYGDKTRVKRINHARKMGNAAMKEGPKSEDEEFGTLL
jgi:ribosome-associated translation inhibitor RaiA